MCEETNVGTYVHSTNGGCFSGGIPFVQCELVAPLVVDGSPTIKSSCSVGVNGFTGSGFICICSEELVLVLCGARIRGHCGRLQFNVPLHMLGSTFVMTPFNPGNVAAGSSPACWQSDYTICTRGV